MILFVNIFHYLLPNKKKKKNSKCESINLTDLRLKYQLNEYTYNILQHSLYGR